MIHFSMPHPDDVAEPHGRCHYADVCEFPCLLAGHNARKRSHVGKFPATFWVKSNSYRRLFLLHSQ